MRLLKSLFGLYLLFLCFLCFYYVLGVATRIGKCELYWDRIMPVLIIIVPTLVLCLCDAIRLLVRHKQLFQNWKSLAVMSNVFCVLATGVLGYLFCENSLNRNRHINLIDRPQEKITCIDVGQKAPPFLASDQYGHEISLSNFKGRFVVLDFWATWCSPCLEQLDALEDIHKSMSDKGVIVIGINMDSDRQKFQSFINSKGASYSQISDDKKAISKNYGITAIPAIVLVDANGVVVAQERLGARIKNILLTKLQQ